MGVGRSLISVGSVNRKPNESRTRADGVSTITRLRRDHPNLCLIVLTGDSDPKLHAAATRAGADAVLEKHEMARGLVDRLAAGRTFPVSGEGRT